jgi:glycosyltransferase involved in cell wall biosynthesis
MDPKVAVVIPTYQRAEMLYGVVREVLSQPLKEIEVAVVDDGSTDDTAARMTELSDPRLSYYNLAKVGVPGVVNAGIERTKAPLIMLLHDHDRFEPSLLAELAGALERNPTAAFAFCGYRFYDSNLEHQQEEWLLDLPELTNGQEFLRSVLMPRINSPVLALSMFRRSLLQGELLDPEIGGCADVELWHRLAATGDVVYVRKPLIDVRGRDPKSQFSSSASALDLMARTLRAKTRFLCLMPAEEREALQNGWARQVDQGAMYVAWKALESSDRATLGAAKEYVAEAGSARGRHLLNLASALPAPLVLGMLRTVRRIHRSTRKNTL